MFYCWCVFSLILSSQLQEIGAMKEQHIKDKKQEVADLRARLKAEHTMDLEKMRKDLERAKDTEVANVLKLEGERAAAKEKVWMRMYM